MSLVTKVELQIVARHKLDTEAARRLDVVFATTGIEFIAFDERQSQLAKEGFERYGRGSGSPARLNFGDCFSYALARSLDVPLLFKGDDFTHTDIRSALGPS